MKQKAALLLITGLAVIVSLAAGQAKAYRDVQWILTRLDPGESYTNTFDIVHPDIPKSSCIVLWGCDEGGYVPGTPLFDTEVAFLIFDVGGVEAEIVLGPSADPGLQVGIDEFVFFFHVENIDANMQVEADLMADGRLEYTVTNLAGSSSAGFGGGGEHYPNEGCEHKNNTFWLKAAKVEAAIPEPSAALVFAVGFGVIGTRVRQRRRA